MTSSSPSQQRPWGHRWRSSTPFILVCIGIALFAESFLFGFVVPILPYILEDRNHVAPEDIQRLTYQILTTYGAVAVASGLFIGQLADLAKSRQMPLIIGLGIAFTGTALLAASTNLPGVFIGRVLQAIGGTSAWIVGLSTIRDSIEAKNIGKAFGMVSSCVSAGALSGPAVAGLLLDLAGYWVAWGSVLVVLLLDIAMRLVMLEKRGQSNASTPVDTDNDSGGSESDDVGEEAALISDTAAQSYDSVARDPSRETGELPTLAFYKLMLSQKRVIVGLACSVVYCIMLSSYNTTIPTHVKFTFGWGSLQTGLLFATLQGPTILLSPVFGWLRDKFGTKIPATIGFGSLAPLAWLLGAADQKQFPWAGSEESAKHVYIAAVIGIACVTNLMASIGTIEITCAADDLQTSRPGIFGPNGGYSRCYSLSNLSFSTGLLIGPLLSGALADTVGYYYMNIVLGKSTRLFCYSPS
ncbi:putative MFS-type transporter C18.02-like protein [Cladobotryum mycophilum]|uniref:MFS-type transporter C18.02-like protein n=1 Tax=Cladobotryum mycophilum TaxID=491253 RepID=A0ABR0SH31_9HYPO